MSQKEVVLTIEVNKPVAETFAFAINPANTPKWIDSMVVEETSEWPIKVGTQYRNRGNTDAWTEYIVTALEENQLFELRQKDGGYRVRYIFTPLGPTRSRLEYREMVEDGEIENPFTQETLDKLKQIIEADQV